MPGEILVYNPTAVSRETLTAVRASRQGLKGLTVGVIDNAKPNFDVLAGHLARVLQEGYGVADVVYRAKRAPTVPAPESYYEDLAVRCDLVVTGSGD
ncbi:MAG: hypothetical protein IRY95_04840 [Clostridia bacterium]|nr:hypothetical protein [Clostridia bacterium]